MMTAPPNLAFTAATPAEAIAKILAAGRNYHAQGQLNYAEACYRKVLELDAKNADGLHLLGVVAYQANHLDQAVDLIRKAADLKPREAAILVNLGAALRKAGRPSEARDTYASALSLEPTLWEANINLGQACLDLKDYPGAVEAYRKCISISPLSPEAHIGLGNAYKYQQRLREALSAYESALQLAPAASLIYGNVAAVLMDLGEHDKAMEMLDRAVEIDPRPSELRYRLSLKALRMEQFAKGWEDYESRYVAERQKSPRRTPPPPTWNGEPLEGKSIVVWTEQGIGDEILQASMIADVIAAGGRCIIECAPRLVPIFARSFAQTTVRPHVNDTQQTARLVDTDYQCSAASLGRFFRRDISQFPRRPTYLQADAAKVHSLRKRYKKHADGHRLVGISWRSTLDNVNNRKSAALVDWRSVVTIPGVTFVSLQYGDHAAEIEATRETLGADIIHDPSIDALHDMDAFFAQVAAMDEVITVSNTTAHVAGSLGIPTSLLLTNDAIWYWLRDRTDSPWYPSITILRQEPAAHGSAQPWEDVMKRIAGRIHEQTL